MYKEIVYEIFIFVLVIFKFIYIFNVILYHTAGALNWEAGTITFLGNMRDELFRVIDAFVNILLVILFNPANKAIRINNEEQFLLLVYGILGLVQDVSKKY